VVSSCFGGGGGVVVRLHGAGDVNDMERGLGLGKDDAGMSRLGFAEP
jgi:hypothetical protein